MNRKRTIITVSCIAIGIIGGVLASHFNIFGYDITKDAREYLSSRCFLTKNYDSAVCNPIVDQQMKELNAIKDGTRQIQYLAGICLNTYQEIEMSWDRDNELRVIEGKEPIPPRLRCEADILEKFGF